MTGAIMTTVKIAPIATTIQTMPFRREVVAVFMLILSLYVDMPAKKIHKPPAGMPRKAAAYFLYLKAFARITSQI